MKKGIVPLLLTLLLSACGFHLRGMIQVPPWLNHIAIVTKENDKQLLAMLKTQLEGYNIQVDNDPTLANYWLTINHVVLQRQITSVGASTNPRQYTLVLTVEFMLQSRQGKIIKAPRRANATRQLTINNDRILGSTDEENILIGEMKQDIVIQMINQLNH